MTLALLLGLADEAPLAAVRRELAAARGPFVIADQRRLLAGGCRIRINDDGTTGMLDIDGTRVDLAEVSGVYTRLAGWSGLPAVTAEPGLLRRAWVLHHALDTWLETAPVRVANRTTANDSNNSKPYQALIIRDHFDVPATLVTNDPAQVLQFRAEHRRVVYKSISGERSIVTELGERDLRRLSLLACVPVQFQEFVAGTDVRVHVVGDKVVATRVDCAGVDYRYSPAARMTPTTVADDITERCVVLTRQLGLELSGIDLRFAEDGRVVCFEVNPSPAFVAYESVTGQPIARMVARLLLGQ